MTFCDWLNESNMLVERRFDYKGKACVIRARSPLPLAPRCGQEVGQWDLEINNHLVARVLGSLDAATDHLIGVIR
jgi:hypothetical protein